MRDVRWQIQNIPWFEQPFLVGGEVGQDALLDAANLQPATLTRTSVTGGVGEDAYEVTLTYNMPLIIKFVVPGATGNTITLTAVGVDRIN